VTDRSNRDGNGVAIAHERLRLSILTGQLRGGEVLSQARLSEIVDAGRTPLREALRMLQHEGLVVSDPKRRIRIAELSAIDVEELYIARIALETTAIQVTVPQLGSEEIAQLEGWMTQMDHFADDRDLDRLEIPHRKFHSGLIDAGGQRVVQLANQLSDHAERYRRVHGTLHPATWDQRRSEHRAILDAAKANDADAATLALVNHYSRTAFEVIGDLDPDHDATRLRSAIDAELGSRPGVA